MLLLPYDFFSHFESMNSVCNRGVLKMIKITLNLGNKMVSPCVLIALSEVNNSILREIIPDNHCTGCYKKTLLH